MQDILNDYIQSISSKFTYEQTSEMGYRSDFENLLTAIYGSLPGIHIFHDSKSVNGNKPDFVILKNEIPLLYIEAKDIGVSLDKVEQSDQMARYFGYANLILTDYTEFRFYRNGLPYGQPIKIAEYDKNGRTISPHVQNYELLIQTLLEFIESYKEPIRSGSHLAKVMGGKAQRIRENVRFMFESGLEKDKDLIKLYETIKTLLVHDIDSQTFADMYAQTLVYGLFVARYYDESLENFTRQEARDLIPNSNPLLQHFFDHIVGSDFKTGLRYLVDELCEVFAHADVKKLTEEYFRPNREDSSQKFYDPVIHFYEDFLGKYDPQLRKRMGAYYTPQPVVDFIVRSVDQILKNDFSLTGGLSNTSKLENGQHRVQVLDPAVGTGTFISTVIREIYIPFKQNGQEGRWPAYVHNDLLPRIHGFELMMAPYTIAHLRLGIAFRKTGFWNFHRRLSIYLTNSLEQGSEQQQMLSLGLVDSIAEESKEAGKIKNETPVMVVVGNPPYSVSSSNKGKWITELIKVYKDSLNEKNIQPLSDDYIKFIRLAEHFVEKNKKGVVAMITNNSFLDGIIHRQMRKHLLETFDDIFILDLHGNSKKKEESPEGGKDENVFDIQQGVSVNIFIRKDTEKKGLGKVHYLGFLGEREEKFKKLSGSTLTTIDWTTLKNIGPSYFFVPKDFGFQNEYEKGFKLNELFRIFNAGTATGKDSSRVQTDSKILLRENTGGTKIYADKDIVKYLYRPFDSRKIIYDSSLIQRLRKNVMDHMLRENIALITCRKQTSSYFRHAFVTNTVTDRCSVSLQTGEVGYIFPLYVYNEAEERCVNFDISIVESIETLIGKIGERSLFDYIYAVLHSPSYREKYKEFLKIDFPRIPYPKDRQTFEKLVELGSELRELHLLESPILSSFITTYPTPGSDVIEKVEYKDGKILINKTQYFGEVPETAWCFWIGGYQPAQKWLKDRKGRTLSNEEIEHYQRMIVALMHTGKIMKKIDAVVAL